MNNLELTKRAKEYIDSFVNGINPITGETVNANEIINDVRIARCLFHASYILSEVIDNNRAKNNQVKKAPFRITEQQIMQMQVVDKTISLSEFCTNINQFVSQENMMKLKFVTIQNWLIHKGFLTEKAYDYGKIRKVPISIGNDIGIFREESIMIRYTT